MNNESIYLKLLSELMLMAFVENGSIEEISSSASFAAFKEQIEELTFLASVDERNITADTGLPLGYLAKTYAGWSLAIPWMLAEHFPTDETLSEFCGFARHVKVGQSSLLCLSGTSARAGGIAEIGDIDFAEYLFDDKAEVHVAYDQILRSCSPALFPTTAKAFMDTPGERMWVKCPFSANDNEAQDSFLQIVGLRQTKVDFIGNSNQYGYIPITNMIFPSEPTAPKQGLSRSSFTFQEAVMADRPEHLRNTWPLVDMIETFEYMRFLIQDAERYLKDRPVKAAKRAGALIKLLHLPQYDADLNVVLNSEYARSDAARSRITELRSMAANCDRSDGRYSGVLAVLDAINDNDGSLEDYEDRSFDEIKCRLLVQSILNDVRAVLENVDQRLASIIFNQ